MEPNPHVFAYIYHFLKSTSADNTISLQDKVPQTDQLRGYIFKESKVSL